uniref:Uncharacterized protein n=2 Tax=Canis lupus familiaris TaxID=9615 RepID=A0A8P0PH06_CANLF
MAEFGCLASTPTFRQHNSFCMGSLPKKVGLRGCAQMGFLVLFIMPLLISLVAAELPGSTETATLAHPACTTILSKKMSALFNCKSRWQQAAVTHLVLGTACC